MSWWNYRLTALTLCTLAFFATMVAQLVISPVIPAIEMEFGVSSSVTGLALTGLWVSYSISQFPSGILADRYGEREVILTSISFTAVVGGLLALSPSIQAFFVLTLLLGAAAGLHLSATGSAVVGTVATISSWGIAFSVFLVLLMAVLITLGTNRMFELGL